MYGKIRRRKRHFKRECQLMLFSEPEMLLSCRTLPLAFPLSVDWAFKWIASTILWTHHKKVISSATCWNSDLPSGFQWGITHMFMGEITESKKAVLLAAGCWWNLLCREHVKEQTWPFRSPPHGVWGSQVLLLCRWCYLAGITSVWTFSYVNPMSQP